MVVGGKRGDRVGGGGVVVGWWWGGGGVVVGWWWGGGGVVVGWWWSDDGRVGVVEGIGNMGVELMDGENRRIVIGRPGDREVSRR